VLLKQGLKIGTLGEWLTPMFLKQGLVLSPASRKMASSNETQNQDKKA
jgi:hypothetical protein